MGFLQEMFGGLFNNKKKEQIDQERLDQERDEETLRVNIKELIENATSPKDILDKLEAASLISNNSEKIVYSYKDGVFYKTKTYNLGTVGKVTEVISSLTPFPDDIEFQNSLVGLKLQLDESIENEDYVKAASLRDMITEKEKEEKKEE